MNELLEKSFAKIFGEVFERILEAFFLEECLEKLCKEFLEFLNLSLDIRLNPEEIHIEIFEDISAGIDAKLFASLEEFLRESLK